MTAPTRTRIIPNGIDLNAYRPAILAKVKAATGRELRIGGPLEIGVHKGLVIRVNDLALSNAPWGSRPQMLTLGRAEAQVALLPLLGARAGVESGFDVAEMALMIGTVAPGRIAAAQDLK